MEIEQLRAFVTLAQTKNFSKTAEVLHLVQSTVSSRIQVLEDSVGRPLFRRDNRKVELTPMGQTLLPYAQRILTLRDESLVKVKSVGVFQDRISVGSTDSMWRHLVKPVLIDFATKHPEICLLTRTGHSWEIIEMLMDDVVQIGFVYHAPSLAGVEVVTFYEDDIVLVASKDFEIDRKRPVTFDLLKQISFITLTWDGPLQDWTRLALPSDYLPQIQLDQLSMKLSFILAGKGVAFFPRYTVSEELKKGTLVELPLARELKPPRRKSFVIYRQEKRAWPSIQHWLELLKHHGFRLTPYRTKGGGR